MHANPAHVPSSGTEPFASALERALEGRRLLEHPFYRRWEAGELQPGELAEYAAQYRHVEAALVPVLEHLSAALPEGRARDLVDANLADERGNPIPHAELFECFAVGVGAADRPAGPAAAALIALQRRAATDAIDGLATLAAYEVQAAGIAASKGDGLRRHHGAAPETTEFWDVHAALEADHAAWTLEALAQTGAAPDDVERAAREAADAWWAFLDEREAAAPVAVA